MQRELKILLTASTFFMLAAGLFGPIYAIFVEEIGGDLLTAGGAYGAFSISAGILVFIISRWEDHAKHQEKFVVLGYLISVIGFAGYLLIRNPIDLFIVQIIFGIGEAVHVPAFDGLYSKHLDKGKFASEWGLWETQYRITSAVAAGIGGVISYIFGFRALFMIMLIISVTGFLISSLLVSTRKKKYFFAGL